MEKQSGREQEKTRKPAIEKGKKLNVYVYRRSRERKNFLVPIFFARKCCEFFLYYHHHSILLFVLAFFMQNAVATIYSMKSIKSVRWRKKKAKEDRSFPFIGCGCVSEGFASVCLLGSCCENIDSAADTLRWGTTSCCTFKFQSQCPKAICKNLSNQFENNFIHNTKKELFLYFVSFRVFFFSFIFFSIRFRFALAAQHIAHWKSSIFDRMEWHRNEMLYGKITQREIKMEMNKGDFEQPATFNHDCNR